MGCDWIPPLNKHCKGWKKFLLKFTAAKNLIQSEICNKLKFLVEHLLTSLQPWFWAWAVGWDRSVAHRTPPINTACRISAESRDPCMLWTAGFSSTYKTTDSYTNITVWLRKTKTWHVSYSHSTAPKYRISVSFGLCCITDIWLF